MGRNDGIVVERGLSGRKGNVQRLNKPHWWLNKPTGCAWSQRLE
jgi:hypothetical protein